MVIQGSLLEGIQHRMTNGRRLALILIDEASDAQPYQVRSPAGLAHQSAPGLAQGENANQWAVKNSHFHQQRVIVFASRSQIPIFLVEIGNAVRGKTAVGLRALAPGATVIRKPLFNAFDPAAQPDFHQTLQQGGIQDLVVMGYSSQQCVCYTVVGGKRMAEDGQCPGALTLNYEVLSCADVVRPSDPVPWKDHNGVFFYSAP